MKTALGRAPTTEPVTTTASQYPNLDVIDWRTPVRRFRRAITRHVGMIALACCVSVLLLILYERIFQPVFTAEAVLQAELDQDVVRSAYYANWNIFRKGDMKSEPALVKSGRVIHGVVKDLNLKFNDVHHTFLTHVTYLWTDSWLGTHYRLFKDWLFPPAPGVYRPTPEESEMARTADAFKDSVAVEVVPGTTFALVVVKAPNGRAAEYANKVVDVYMAERATLFRNEAEAAYQSLEGEVTRAAEELKAIDQKRFEFDTDNQVVLDFEKDKLVVGSWSALQSSIMDLKSSIASLEASRSIIERQLAAEPEEVTSAKKLEGSRAKALLQSREVELNAALLQTRERYVADSPEVTQLERFLAETRAQLAQEVPFVEIGQDRIVNPIHTDLRQRLNGILAQLASARATLAQKQVPLAELEARLHEIPGLVKQITQMNRTRESLELRYKLLRERLMMADVSRTTVGTIAQSVHIIDYAHPSAKPIWPRNIVLVPAALAMGLFVGIVVAVLRELFSAKVNRDRLAARRDMPVYAVIELRLAGGPRLAESLSNDTRPVAERLRLIP
jgi:uncharacterized protein involved in exopolysaccharide biosynthesis